jgi:hypothetical protein
MDFGGGDRVKAAINAKELRASLPQVVEMGLQTLP